MEGFEHESTKSFSLKKNVARLACMQLISFRIRSQRMSFHASYCKWQLIMLLNPFKIASESSKQAIDISTVTRSKKGEFKKIVAWWECMLRIIFRIRSQRIGFHVSYPATLLRFFQCWVFVDLCSNPFTIASESSKHVIEISTVTRSKKGNLKIIVARWGCM